MQTPAGKHLISYFEVLTDSAFDAFKARGVTSRESLIRTKAERAADPRVCTFTGEDRDFVNLTGGATQTQSVSLQTRMSDGMSVGDTPVAVAASASSGLPVVFVSATPRICTVNGSTVTPRRAGVCKVQATQPGNDETIEARPVTMRSTVWPRGVTAKPPRLGAVYPPTGAGPDSYIRFYNTGTKAGTVTASLINGVDGQTVTTWQSPSIGPGSAPQFSVRDIEGALPAGYERPHTYSLKIEPETTVTGYMQHVLFDAGTEAITNASTCDVGTATASHRLMNVHSSKLESGYPSTIVMFNHGLSTIGMNLTVRDAPTGTDIGRFYSSNLPIQYPVNFMAYPNIQLNFSESALEAVSVLPTGPSVRGPLNPPSHHLNLTDEGGLSSSADGGIVRYFYQHLVTNRRPGVVADFTAMCALNGNSTATANVDMRAGGLLSSLQPLARSTLRFYNAGTTAGPVRLWLYGNTDDQPLGAWVSPEVPAGAVREFDIATIEREATPHRTNEYVPLAFLKQNFYGLKIDAPFEGLFQNVVQQTSGGAYSNASTCFEATGVDAKTSIAVASSAREAEGYVSTVVITNTGGTSASAKLDVYDARDGTALGSFQTGTIPANGLLKLDGRAIETAASIPADPARTQYVIKADESFTGFLQHLLNNRNQGVVSDMTAVCLM